MRTSPVITAIALLVSLHVHSSSVGAGEVVTSDWAGALGSAFTVKLEQGSVTKIPDGVALRGTVVVSVNGGPVALTPTPTGPVPIPMPNVTTRVVLRNANVVAKERASAPVAARARADTSSNAAKVEAAAVANPAGRAMYTSLSGKGDLEVSMGPYVAGAGQQPMVTIQGSPSGSLAIDSTGGDTGQSCQTKTTQVIMVNEVNITSTSVCPKFTLERSSIARGDAITGTVKLTMFGQTLTGSIRAKLGETPKALVAWQNQGAGGWHTLPNDSHVEYRIARPKLEAEVVGYLLTRATLIGDRVEVRSVEKQPNGDPWATASVSLPPVAIATTGLVQLPLPQLPQPQRTPEQVKESMCDATCGILKELHLDAAVPNGTGAGKYGSLKFVDDWHNQCELIPHPLGNCKNDTVCAPPWQKFDDGGVKKCRLPSLQPPTVSTVPSNLQVAVGTVVS